MRHILSLALILFCTLGLFMTDAHAKRFGGGRSFGMQRSMGNFSRYQRPPTQMQTPRSNSNRWLAPLAGLAIGSILGSLFMSHGLASGMMSWLVLGGIALLMINLLRSRRQQVAPAMQYNNMYSQSFGDNIRPINNSSAASASFDSALFLREAKALFIRLQAAYDQKNLNDIRKFTAPEVFAEIQLQVQERGNEANQTDVLSLEAAVLDVSSEHQETIASVHFTGMISENNAAATPLNEIWHFQLSTANQMLLVTGIEQAH